MTIGQALKKCRLNAGLTQQQWVAGIVSESYYSKVERDIHEIDANLLLKILNTNQIDVTKFFRSLSDKQNVLSSFDDRIMDALNRRDKEAFVQVKKEVLANTEDKDRVEVKLAICESMLNQTDKNITPELRKKINKIFIKTEWDSYSYNYLAMVMLALDMENAYQLLHSAFQAFRKNKVYDSVTIQSISMATLNFLDLCHKRNYSNIERIDEAIAFLRSVPVRIENSFAQVFVTYFDALFHHKEELLEACIEVLKESNMYQYVEKKN